MVLSRSGKVRDEISEQLHDNLRHVIPIDNPQTVLGLIRRGRADIIVADTSIHGNELYQLAEAAHTNWPDAEIILLTEDGASGGEVDIGKVYIDAFVQKSAQIEKLRETLEKLEKRKRTLESCGLVGYSETIREIAETILQIAPTNVNILITGESGTGKELVAKAIHTHSTRQSAPFLAVNCGALAESLLESELFGHEKGSFTGSVGRRKGVFELTHSGTIFLDEIGEMSPATQVKLLRVLEEKEFMRLGGSESIKVDVRIISATNKNLTEEISNNKFRRDLYYRLRVIEINIPPLRERREDIPILINAFIQEYCQKNDVSFAGISKEAMEELKRYPWPGNVRELKNFVEHMIVLPPAGQISVSDLSNYIDEGFSTKRNLPVQFGQSSNRSELELIYASLLALKVDIGETKSEVKQMKDILMDRLGFGQVLTPHEVDFMEEGVEADDDTHFTDANIVEDVREDEVLTLNDLEREAIKKALEKTEGNRKKAARMLGIGERTLYRKLRAYGLR